VPRKIFSTNPKIDDVEEFPKSWRENVPPSWLDPTIHLGAAPEEVTPYDRTQDGWLAKDGNKEMCVYRRTEGRQTVASMLCRP
jgi:hypothetical protein